MGCCSSVKRTEEEEILNYFNKILKENNFNFTIKNYKYNYDTISQLSGNNFKKLSKKQKVCLGFIKIIKKDASTITNDKNRENEMPKILFHIIILTILLDHKIQDQISDNNNDNVNNNDYIQINKNNLINLKRDFLSHGYNLFNAQYNDLNNNKLIIYYLSKMFYLCFIDFIDASNYVSINTFISKVKLIIDSKCLVDEEENYIFIRDNILTLGQFFHYEKNFILSEEDMIDNLLDLYPIILNHHYDYFTNNFLIIKENINKNIRITTNKLMNINLINKENLLPNMEQIFNIINSSNINNNVNSNYKDCQDIYLIIENLYYFLEVSIQDIHSGKNIFNLFGNKLIEKIKEDNHNNKYNDIILLLLFYECCIKDEEKLILCLLDYIGELFFNNNSNNIQINSNNIYYDITLDSYYLIYKNETLNKQYISLLSNIFVKEVKNNIENPLIITQLIQIYHKKEKMINNLIKLFFYFLLNLSHNYKEKINIINNHESNNIDDVNNNLILIKNMIINLNSIIKTHFINNNGFSSLASNDNNNNNYINSSTNNITYNAYNKDYSNCVKLEIPEYELIIKNFFNFKNIKNEKFSIIEFYLCLHLFIINNMDVRELINDDNKKEKIYNSLFKVITKLEIMLIQDSYKDNSSINIINDKNECNKNILINSILMDIQIILIIIKIHNTRYIQDCFLLYKSIEKNVQSLLDIKKNEIMNDGIESFNLKIIYSILFFILSQFIRLINIPNSIIKNHKEIIDCISKVNEKCSQYLSSIDVTNFIIIKESIEPNCQYLKDILLLKDNINESFYINYNSFKNILDIIYSKLFGKECSLYIFFENQISNSKISYNIGINSFDRSVSKLSDNITEPKDNSIINYYANNYNDNNIDDISFQIIEQKKKQKNNSNDINNISMSNDSRINMPYSNVNIVTDEKISSYIFTNEDNPYQSLKI